MPLDPAVIDALAATRTIDLTTLGRMSGRPASIEIWWFHVDGRFIITGTPGPRDWYANVLANPAVIIHAIGRSYEGRAEPITDRAFRRRVFTHPQIDWYSTQAQLETLIDTAPMISVELSNPA